MKKKYSAVLRETRNTGIFSTGLFLKTLFVLLSVGAFSLTVAAQDLIKLKSGKELKVIIVEENETSVRYREFENKTGPVYTVKKENVEAVVYKKRSKESQENRVVEQVKPVQDNNLPDNAKNILTVDRRNLLINGQVQSARAVRLMMEDQPGPLRSYNSARKLYTLSNSCPLIVMVITFPATQIINKKTEQSDKLRIGIPVLCVDGVLVIAGILFAKKGTKELKNSASLYNSSLDKPAKYTINFGIQENGVGVAVRF